MQKRGVMRHYLLIATLLCFLSSSSNASDDYRAIAIEAKNHTSEQMLAYRQDAENAKNTERNIVQLYQSDAQFAQMQEKETLLKNQLTTNTDSNTKKMSSILIFVSFSMPTQSLEAYLRDAKKIHASVVIRGLIDNSFQKTYRVIADLVKTSGGDGVELNPIWFKRFGVQVVPAIVVVPEGSPCFKNDTCKKESDFDIMTGDITLSSALKIIRDRGRLTSDIAQAALSKLQGLSDA